jgi:hypothetical protein
VEPPLDSIVLSLYSKSFAVLLISWSSLPAWILTFLRSSWSYFLVLSDSSFWVLTLTLSSSFYDCSVVTFSLRS